MRATLTRQDGPDRHYTCTEPRKTVFYAVHHDTIRDRWSVVSSSVKRGAVVVEFSETWVECVEACERHARTLNLENAGPANAYRVNRRVDKRLDRQLTAKQAAGSIAK